MNITPDNWRRWLFLIFTLALLIRVGFVLNLQDGYYFPDSVSYSAAAVNLITKGELGESYNRPPGYPVFLAAIYVFFGESILAVRMVESLMGAFLAVVIALIGRRIGGDTVGAIAGFLWSIYPIGVFIAGLVYPTGLLTMLLACGVLCLLPDSHQELSPKRAFVGGVLWGLAALTKPTVLATVGAVGLWMMCQSRAKRLLPVSLLFLGSAVTVVPWVIRDFYFYDRLVIVEPRVVEHLPRVLTSEDSVRERKRLRPFVDRYISEFLRFWKLYPERIVMDWPDFREAVHMRNPQVVKETVFGKNDLIMAVSILSTGPVFFFAILGTVAMWFHRGRRRDLTLLWAIILSFAVVYSIFYAKTRYRIPIEPYIIVLSAYGLRKTWGVLAKRVASGVAVQREVVESVKVGVESRVPGD